MAFDPEIAGMVEEITRDREHSASWLSLRAIGTLRLAAGKSAAPNAAAFLDEMRSVAREMAEAKPPMAPIANLVAEWFYEIAHHAPEGAGCDALKSFAILQGEKIGKARRGALNRVAEHGSQLVEDNDILISCSDSVTVLESLVMARKAGKEFGVYVAESRNAEGRSYGESMAGKLQSENVAVKLIQDTPESIAGSVARSAKVMVGADGVLDNGSIINGSPTLLIAESAGRGNIPFYVVCETTKFSALKLAGRHLWLDEEFEMVPAELVTRIVTDEGVLDRDQAVLKVTAMSRYLRALWE